MVPFCLFASAPASYHNLDPPPLPPVKIMLLGSLTVSHSFSWGPQRLELRNQFAKSRSNLIQLLHRRLDGTLPVAEVGT
jgi:hypothetical protein